jgi:hypothetical protein
MKKLLLIFLSVFLVSCSNNTAPEPEHLLEEEEMVSILYDLALLQSIKSFNPAVLDTNNVDSHKYIYKKYKIDSLTFAQNHTYYASDIETYEKIEKEVTKKIQNGRDALKPKIDTTAGKKGTGRKARLNKVSAE